MFGDEAQKATIRLHVGEYAKKVGHEIDGRLVGPEKEPHAIPAEAVEPVTDAIVSFAAELIQHYIDAGSERDMTHEDLWDTVEDHVKGWVEPFDNKEES